jgi:DNA-binding response OmpR family regulator
MVVDDEAMYCARLSYSLSQQGHDVRTATSGREAIAVAGRFRPDVLITDWMLRNHYHGVDVSRRLRVVNPELKTIVITGYPTGDVQAEAGEIRCVLAKPFTMDEISGVLQNVLQT